MEYQVCYINSILYFIYFSIYFMVSERLPALAFEQHGSGYDDDMSFERMNIYVYFIFIHVVGSYKLNSIDINGESNGCVKIKL